MLKTWSEQDRMYLKSDRFERAGGVAHGFTARMGGVSQGKIQGLNLGFRVQDDPAAVKENYALVSGDLGIPVSDMVLAKQTHTTHIRLTGGADRGKGVVRDSDIQDTDGLMTDETGVGLVIFTADCVPLLFYDPVRRVIAAVHAGWRGTAAGIGGKAARMMQREFGCLPKNILAAIGPSIGPCCFEVEADTACQFDEKYCTPKTGGKFLVDLWRVNRDQLLAEGMLPENVDVAEVCTMCRADTFYSYRTHREHTGRQGALIMLQN